MKKLLFFFLFLMNIGLLQAGYIQHELNLINPQTFVHENLFFQKEKTFESITSLHHIVSNYDLLTLNLNSLKHICTEKPNALEIIIPINGKLETIHLIQSKIIDKNTRFLSQSANGKNEYEYESGVYYHGIIVNNPNSIASISFFNDDVMGVIGVDDGNYVVGRRNTKDLRSIEFIVYNDRDLLMTNSTSCDADEDYRLPKLPDRQQLVLPETISTNCVKVYIECDYQFFLDHSSNVTSAINFATGIFNLTHSLYLNDSISTGISQILVWSITDPYISATTTSSMLNLFGAAMSGGFNGDLAHLFSTRSLGGGIAWIDVLCDLPEYRTAVSASLGSSLIALPTYSWNANVVTHEMGHNLGSSHTHSCVWNGNNTRIDNCGGHAGYPSGTCADILPDPPAGGTMMSYCHLLSGIGINFNLGFGPLPGMLIRSKVNNASCLTSCLTCASDLTITNLFSAPLTESSTWIKSMGQTNIDSTTNIILDADPTNGYVLLEPTSSSDFIKSAPDPSHYFVAQAYDGCGNLQPYRALNNTSATIINTSTSILLYPIPAEDIIILESNLTIEETISYDILTIDGSLIRHNEMIKLNPTAEIMISSFNPGLYVLKVYRKNQVEMLKFQKR